MAGNVNHDYHILEPDIWPLIGSMSALTFTSGMVLSFYPDLFGMASKHCYDVGRACGASGDVLLLVPQS